MYKFLTSASRVKCHVLYTGVTGLTDKPGGAESLARANIFRGGTPLHDVLSEGG